MGVPNLLPFGSLLLLLSLYPKKTDLKQERGSAALRDVSRTLLLLLPHHLTTTTPLSTHVREVGGVVNKKRQNVADLTIPGYLVI